jgi:hypothetical protein
VKRGRRVIGIDLGDNTLEALTTVKKYPLNLNALNSYKLRPHRTVSYGYWKSARNRSLSIQRHPPETIALSQAYELPLGSASLASVDPANLEEEPSP